MPQYHVPESFWYSAETRRRDIENDDETLAVFVHNLTPEREDRSLTAAAIHIHVAVHERSRTYARFHTSRRPKYPSVFFNLLSTFSILPHHLLWTLLRHFFKSLHYRFVEVLPGAVDVLSERRKCVADSDEVRGTLVPLFDLGHFS
jgi:hypothetical protein